MNKKVKQTVKRTFVVLKREAFETKVMCKLAFKKNKTEKEMKIFKEQRKEVFAALLMSPLFILPGGGIGIVLLVKLGKKMGTDFFTFKKQI